MFVKGNHLLPFRVLKLREMCRIVIRQRIRENIVKKGPVFMRVVTTEEDDAQEQRRNREQNNNRYIVVFVEVCENRVYYYEKNKTIMSILFPHILGI